MASAVDNCDPAPTVTATDSIAASGVCLQEYTIYRTWTASDDCGNTSSCTQIIIIDDSTPPVISCPGDVTLDCTASTLPSAVAAPGFASATDDCDPEVIPTYSDVTIEGACPQEYTITRTWVAIDDCGNSSNCVQLIAVEDNTPPAIICPVDLTIECSDTIPTTAATATDNCGDVTIPPYTDMICDNPVVGFTGVYDA